LSEGPIMVGFTASPGILGTLIREAEARGAVSHAFLAWDSECFGGRMTLGANWNGLTVEPFEVLVHDRPVLFSCAIDLWPGVRALRRFINGHYDYAALLGMVAVEAEQHLRHRMIKNPLASKADFFCSEYVAAVIRASGLGIMPYVPQGSIDPAALFASLKGPASYFQEVAG
jgi:hypothetical protein